MIDAFLAEMEMEARTTRKFLEALPADQLGYKPTAKSMSAGHLAMHIATIPGEMAAMASQDEFTMRADDPRNHDPNRPEPTKEAILARFEESLARFKETLSGFDDAKCAGGWSLKINGEVVMTMPRIVMVRTYLMNHLYHHRGQFGVYLRLMGARVPASYGPSGDENPLGN